MEQLLLGLGYDFPKTCEAIHVNILIVRHPDGPQTKEEKKWEESFESKQINGKWL